MVYVSYTEDYMPQFDALDISAIVQLTDSQYTSILLENTRKNVYLFLYYLFTKCNSFRIIMWSICGDFFVFVVAYCLSINGFDPWFHHHTNDWNALCNM